jgi:hypothetical protein
MRREAKSGQYLNHRGWKNRKGCSHAQLNLKLTGFNSREIVGVNPKTQRNTTQLVGTGNQLWPPVDKSKHLIEYVKRKTLGWTVGPADFCGNAHIIGEGGRGRQVLCIQSKMIY